MFRRMWWTRSRIVVGLVLAVLLAGAVVWECGTDEVREGQPLDEAKAVLWRAGAVDKTAVCGMHTTLGGRRPTQVVDSMWEFPDGRTLFLVATRESDGEPFRVYSFDMWNGWPKHDGTVGLPVGDSVHLRRNADPLPDPDLQSPHPVRLPTPPVGGMVSPSAVSFVTRSSHPVPEGRP